MWAKENLAPVTCPYVVAYQPELDQPVKLMYLDSNWCAAAMHGGIVPPVETIIAMREDEARPGFARHSLGPARDAAIPCQAMSMQEAVEYQIMQSLPMWIWSDEQQSNHRRMIICELNKVPASREFRNAWRLAEAPDGNTLH